MSIKIPDDIKQLATVIHDATCRSNHMDGCDWEYHSWDKHEKTDGKMGYARREYKKKAIAVITVLTNSGIDRDDIDLDLLTDVFVAATTHHGF